MEKVNRQSAPTEPNDDDYTLAEQCGDCGRETEHKVEVSIVSTSDEQQTNPENRKFARVPCRTTTCLSCGTVTERLRR
ncbi:hypothetical protein AUR64_10330 [Haloprofundus marisrubri]|uniref:DUF7835 domain-containing protein n=1 Tax=Haloprofundus marisrubri TaxID=1514971 RepID=A0A0W1R9J7_9EURY|nr:hypothetical protein AUR64_10330 [Haloprofundus marisrubri]